MIKKIKSDKQLFGLLLTIALPLALQNLLSTLTQMADTIMLGELGDVQLTASSLANQIFFVYSLFIFGFGGGCAILTSQYWGKKEIRPIKIIMATALRIVLVVGILVSILMLVFPAEVMSLFSKDTEVIEAAVEYLSVSAYIYPIFGFSCMLIMLFRSVELVKLAVFANITTLIVNVSLNYILIFGNFGAPKLELLGAAYATLAARIIELIVVCTYVFVVEKNILFKIKNLVLRNKELSLDMRKYCTPVVINELLWASGMTLQAALFGNLSTTAVAANSIISVVQNLSSMVIFGVANAAAIIIGKTIGEGKIDLAKQRSKTLELFAIVLGIFAAGVILLLRNVMVDFYNVEEATKILAKEMLLITSVIVFFMSTSAMSIIGILRGGGDTKYALFCDVTSLWLFSVPVGYIAGLLLNAPIVVVYFIFKSDEIIKAILCWIRLASDKWISIVTRGEINYEETK